MIRMVGAFSQVIPEGEIPARISFVRDGDPTPVMFYAADLYGQWTLEQVTACFALAVKHFEGDE